MVSPPTPERRTPLEPVTTDNKVRVLSTHPDPFAGLKGRDYIQARGLNKPVTRVQTNARVVESEVDK